MDPDDTSPPEDDGREPSSISVIVRALNSARTLPACLESVRAQTLPAEVVLVDSGSTDDTVALARSFGATIVTIPPGEFTYGRALNRGAEAAQGDVHVALSSHCVLPDPEWLSHVVANLSIPRVAATTGHSHDSSGNRLHGPLVVDASTRIVDPYWSYSNHAGAWWARAWREMQFREDLIACEDTEWSDRLRRAGYSIIHDPRLLVAAEHRKTAGLKALRRRRMKEVYAIASVRDVEPPGMFRLIGKFLFDHPAGYNKVRRLGSPYRVAELTGEWQARRAVLRERRTARQSG